jgi:glutamate--cysteine ligase
MGPLGYQSNAQSNLGVSYNCLRSYAESLSDALTTPYPPYEAIGLQDPNGEYRQLSTSLLQIENEFYGTIRPKQPVRSGERPLRALATRGVEYVEVRLMDLDPFSPVGITAEAMRFLDVFLLHCLLQDSPRDSPATIATLSRNRHAVAQRGREPGLELEKDDGSRIALPDWGRELLDACQPVAAALDAAHGGDDDAQVLDRARELLADPGLTPSAQVLERVSNDDSASCTGFSLRQSLRHRQTFLAEPLPAEVTARYEMAAAQSLAAQRAAEEADRLPFDVFRQQYISQPLVEDTPATTRSAG